jgi:hypothetical protein
MIDFSQHPVASFGVKYALCLGGCLLLHRVLGFRKNLRRQTKWYLIHTVGNAIIVSLTLKDLVKTTMDPLGCLNNISDYSSLTNYHSYPVIVMSAIHTYHILLYYKEMVAIDWIHHLASGGLVGSICTFYITGSIVNHGLFFMCGLPGGIDYLMLTLNDMGKMSRFTEKRINRLLNMYIRMPGILFNCFCGFLNYLYLDPFPYNFSLAAAVFLLDMWNAIYFAQRVTENYGYHVAKQKNDPEDGNLKS